MTETDIRAAQDFYVRAWLCRQRRRAFAERSARSKAVQAALRAEKAAEAARTQALAKLTAADRAALGL